MQFWRRTNTRIVLIAVSIRELWELICCVHSLSGPVSEFGSEDSRKTPNLRAENQSLPGMLLTACLSGDSVLFCLRMAWNWAAGWDLAFSKVLDWLPGDGNFPGKGGEGESEGTVLVVGFSMFPILGTPFARPIYHFWNLHSWNPWTVMSQSEKLESCRDLLFEDLASKHSILSWYRGWQAWDRGISDCVPVFTSAMGPGNRTSLSWPWHFLKLEAAFHQIMFELIVRAGSVLNVESDLVIWCQTAHWTRYWLVGCLKLYPYLVDCGV